MYKWTFCGDGGATGKATKIFRIYHLKTIMLARKSIRCGYILLAVILDRDQASPLNFSL